MCGCLGKRHELLVYGCVAVCAGLSPVPWGFWCPFRGFGIPRIYASTAGHPITSFRSTTKYCETRRFSGCECVFGVLGLCRAAHLRGFLQIPYRVWQSVGLVCLNWLAFCFAFISFFL